MADMYDKINELYDRRREIELGGGDDKIEKQHAKGKLTARERIDLLLDEGTFVELNPFIEHRCTDFGLEGKKGCAWRNAREKNREYYGFGRKNRSACDWPKRFRRSPHSRRGFVVRRLWAHFLP
jgi:hypothetical protein